MSFASASLAATPTGNKPISAFVAGDNITVWTPNGTETRQVAFSNGTTESYLPMVYLSLNNGHDTHRSIIFDTRQPVMMADHTLRHADKLQYGDELLNPNGQPFQVRNVSIGEYIGGVHSVQTNGAAQGTDGHLIIVHGLVCGDFQVDVNFKGN